MSSQPRLFEMPIVGLYQMDVEVANRLLVEWDHKLGACERPFHQEAFALELSGEPIAVAISASIVNGPVAGFERQETVELARMGARVRWANRVMLRLWRESCAQLWPCWPVKAAISYSKNSMHSGNLYRFDGWEKVREDCGSSGGGTYSRRRHPTEAVHGSKTLWLWRFEP